MNTVCGKTSQWSEAMAFSLSIILSIAQQRQRKKKKNIILNWLKLNFGCLRCSLKREQSVIAEARAHQLNQLYAQRFSYTWNPNRELNNEQQQQKQQKKYVNILWCTAHLTSTVIHWWWDGQNKNCFCECCCRWIAKSLKSFRPFCAEK